MPIMVMSIVNGFHYNIRSKILDKDFHLQVYHRDDMLDNYNKVIKEIEKIAGIKHAFAFHDGKAIIKFEGEKTGIAIRGIEQRMYEQDESFRSSFRLIKGNVHLSAGNRIILGIRLAKLLRAKVGDVIELFVDREENTTGFNFAVKRFKVGGIFQSGYNDFDSNLVFISLKDAQVLYNYESDFFGIKNYRAWGLGLKLHDPEKIEKIRQVILDTFTDLRVRTFMQLNGNLLYAFDWEKKLMMVVLLIMVMATVLTVMLILTVVVMSKKKEIGILKSFGVKHSVIMRIFLIEGFIISFTGTLIGIILGVVLTIFVKEIALSMEYFVNHFIDIVRGTWIGGLLGIEKNMAGWEIVSAGSHYSRNFPIRIYFSDIFILSVMTLFWSLIGALLPAKKATKITVIEAIRHE